MRILYLLCCLMFSSVASAGSPNVYTASVKGEFDVVYKHVYDSLEKNRFFVVLEPDIGKNISRFAKKWGDDYNQNKLERMKSMVFCNGWYANLVSNADPEMVAMCPLHLTMTHKAGITSVHFVRPDKVAQGSKAEKVAKELTEKIIKAIDAGMKLKN